MPRLRAGFVRPGRRALVSKRLLGRLAGVVFDVGFVGQILAV